MASCGLLVHLHNHEMHDRQVIKVMTPKLNIIVVNSHKCTNTLLD